MQLEDAPTNPNIIRYATFDFLRSGEIDARLSHSANPGV
jgi:hypothetical protein